VGTYHKGGHIIKTLQHSTLLCRKLFPKSLHAHSAHAYQAMPSALHHARAHIPI